MLADKRYTVAGSSVFRPTRGTALVSCASDMDAFTVMQELNRLHYELADLRLALRVLAMEVVATRAERESFFDNSRYDVWRDCVRRAGEAAQRTDANSLASAEIEAVKKERGT